MSTKINIAGIVVVLGATLALMLAAVSTPPAPAKAWP